MKKSLLALAVLGAFAGAAAAQSTVTLYGRVDLSLNKPIGTESKGVANGSGSRLGVRGVEDLGGGLKALFQIEHRFNADTGAQTNPESFWHGRSIVGLEGGFGRFWMGREYTPVFLTGELIADPWGFDTVAAQGFLTGGVDSVRRHSTVNYQYSAGGFTGWFQIAESEENPAPGAGTTNDRPWGLALTYGAGPLYVGYAYDNPAGNDDKWHFFTATYNFGGFKLLGGYGTGDRQATLNTTVDAKAWTIGATVPVGAGEFRAAYGQQERGSVDTVKQFGLGYHYAMSKRTTLYFDYARNSKATTPVGDPEKFGYDVGVKHNF